MMNFSLRYLIGVAVLPGILAGCSGTPTETKPDVPSASNDPASPPGTPTTASGSSAPSGGLTKLEIIDLEPGTGEPAKVGDTVTVRYSGKFKDGKEFDGNIGQLDKPPFPVRIGQGEVIKGWDEGLVGVKVGMKRKLNIPWRLAYGEAGNSGIPGKTDLYFEIHVEEITKKEDSMVVRYKVKKEGAGSKGLKSGTEFIMTYKGTTMGNEFDSKTNFKTTYDQLVPALKSAMLGMKQGETRILKVPPALASGIPRVGRGASVEYEVTINKIN